MSESGNNSTWICSHCGEKLEPQFHACWNCGTTKDGNLSTNDIITKPDKISENVETTKKRFSFLDIVVFGALGWLCLSWLLSGMSPERFRFISSFFVYGFLIFLIPTFLFIWYFARRKKKPFSSEAPVIDSNAMALCPNCLTPNNPNDHFCIKCVTPLTSHAAIDPIASIQATGDTYRKAANRPSGRSVLIGMWLIFAPQIPFLIYAAFGAIINSSDIIYHRVTSNDPNSFYIEYEMVPNHREIFSYLFSLIVIAGLLLLYTLILIKVTKNYVSKKESSRV